MTTGQAWARALLGVASLAFGAAFASPANATCADIGGTGTNPCTVAANKTITAASPISVADDVVINSGVTITVPPAASPFTLNVTGNFTMAPGSVIDGSSNVNPGQGADITINADGNITLTGGNPGAIIRSNHAQASSCTGTSRGGNISLNADHDNDFEGNVDQGTGSKIDSISACGLGELTVTGRNINLDGEVRTEGVKTVGRGGPITVNAKCNLNISDTGELISLGHDAGADLVHLQGGCDVKVFGLVASTGPGHNKPPKNRCDSNNPGAAIRPGKPNNSTACVEIWSGGPLLIDSVAHNGEVNADVGQSGGPEGLGWIELLAVGDVTIIGDASAAGTTCTPITFTGGGKLPTYAPCFAVHANQGTGGLTNGFGGLIRVTSTTGSVIASGRALQASDTANGGKGGRPALTIFCTAGAPCGGITIEGDVDVDLTGATVEAKGAANNGAGGQIDALAFNGAIKASAATSLVVTGGTPPNGVVHLTACTTIAFPPGVVTPAGALTPPGGTTGVCGAHPVLPAYVDTQSFPLGPFPTVIFGAVGGEKGCPAKCEGDCQCVSTFRLLTSPANTVELRGVNLGSTTKVRLSTASCDTTTGTNVTFTKVTAPAPTRLRINVGGVPTGDYHIITESGINICCTLDTVHIP